MRFWERKIIFKSGIFVQWDFVSLEFLESGILRKWDFGKVRFWESEVMGKWNSVKVGFWGFFLFVCTSPLQVLVLTFNFKILGFGGKSNILKSGFF